jgi:hypothetical protein
LPCTPHSQAMYKPGDHLALCDSCGRRFYGSELRKDWRGFMVCKKDYEPRHTQDNVQTRSDRQTVPNARPEVTDVFLNPGDVTAEDL